MIAAITFDRDTGGYDAVTFARVLIATGALLINMAHVVAAIRAETAKGRPRRRRPFVI